MGGKVLKLKADKLLDEYNKGKGEGKEEGLIEGKIEGKIEERDISARLFAYLKETDRLDEYERALSDDELREKLISEMEQAN
jgi:hypothetical protein